MLLNENEVAFCVRVCTQEIEVCQLENYITCLNVLVKTIGLNKSTFINI